MKLRSSIRRIDSPAGRMKILILRPEKQEGPVPGILWLHGGGYVTGMASMVYITAGSTLAKHFGTVLIAPEYRRALRNPYPAALEDCYAALEYLYSHADELGVDRNRIVVGGESAGGGLAAAVCLLARDEGEIPVSFQLPLYPMPAIPTAGVHAATTGPGANTWVICTERTRYRLMPHPRRRPTMPGCRPAIPLWKTKSLSWLRRLPIYRT